MDALALFPINLFCRTLQVSLKDIHVSRDIKSTADDLLLVLHGAGLFLSCLGYWLIYVPLKYIIPASEALQDYWLIKKRVSSFLSIMGTYLDAEMQIIALARKIEEKKNSRQSKMSHLVTLQPYNYMCFLCSGILTNKWTPAEDAKLPLIIGSISLT